MIIPCPGFTSPTFIISEEELLALVSINKNKKIKVLLEKIKKEGMRNFEETKKRFRDK